MWDIRGWADASVIYTYTDDMKTELIDRQDIDYVDYDKYGNALYQTISSWTNEVGTVAKDYKEIVNIYTANEEMWDRRGLADESIIRTYTSGGGLLVERQDIDYIEYDQYGNVIHQTVTSFLEEAVVTTDVLSLYLGEEDADETLSDLIAAGYVNENGVVLEDFRGLDDVSQFPMPEAYSAEDRQLIFDMLTETVDATSLDFKDIINHYESENPMWNIKGWPSSTEITTYVSDGGAFIEFQDIEYDSYDRFGNATAQSITTWKDILRSDVKDYKLIYNTYSPYKMWDRQGWADEIVIVTYTEEGGEFIDRQKIDYQDYDPYGNALGQNITSFFEQAIVTRDLLLDNISASDALPLWDNMVGAGYVDEEGLIQESFMQLDSAEQMILDASYTEEQKTEVFDLFRSVIDGTVMDYKEITNVYEDLDADPDMMNARKSQVMVSTVITRTSEGGELVDAQKIEYAGYDAWGNALQQSITSYFDAALVEVKEYKKIKNTYDPDSMDARRGLAETTEIVTYTSDGGELVDRQLMEYTGYDAWGNVTVFDSGGTEIEASNIGNRYLFQGREYDSSTGLYYFRARWYDPAASRWLSKDPIGIAGGLNQYVFCNNNPVNCVDPYGCAFSEWVGLGSIILAVIAMAVPEPASTAWGAASLSAAIHAALIARAENTIIDPPEDPEDDNPPDDDPPDDDNT